MSGRNWGDAVIDGSTLVFNVAGKPAFRIPLTDVGQVCATQHITSYHHNMHCRAVVGHQHTVLFLCTAAHILHCHKFGRTNPFLFVVQVHLGSPA